MNLLTSYSNIILQFIYISDFYMSLLYSKQLYSLNISLYFPIITINGLSIVNKLVN